jgi:hypothetical protein
MHESLQRLFAAKSVAEQRFLGKDFVVGIAVSRKPEELVFFLGQESKFIEKEILTWAKDFDIRADVRIIGGFESLID